MEPGMICIPISATTNAEMLLNIHRAASEPAELYELRFDSIHGLPMVEELIAACPSPVIATCRSVREGGGFSGDDALRQSILRRAALAGAAYVDCEPADVDSLEGVGNAIRIASLHDFQKTPDDLDGQVAALAATRAEWVKFAVAATSLADNLKVFAALKKCDKPAIAVAMGEKGLLSRVLGCRLGSMVTFGSMHVGMESAPGQTTASQLAKLYRVGMLGARTAVYGVLGAPGSSAAYRMCMAGNLSLINTGANAVCLPFLVEDAADFLDAIPEALDMPGFVVMDEHQRAALEWAGVGARGTRRPEGAVSLFRVGSEWMADAARPPSWRWNAWPVRAMANVATSA